MNNNNNEIDMGYILGVISILLGMINLQENREQSAHNDIQIANDKQAKYLLEGITQKFDEQNEMLEKIKKDLKFNTQITLVDDGAEYLVRDLWKMGHDLLSNINKRFDEQNKMLENMLKLLERK